MANNLVVKTNQINSALQNLSLAEIHIIQLGIVGARETGQGLDITKPLRIDALKYAEVFGTSRQNAYKRLKEAEETLFNRRFSYINTNGNLVKSRWISQVEYLSSEGSIEICFTPAVVEGISRIDGVENFFTSYLLEQTSSMTSNYSVRLYELIVQWKVAKKTPVFELQKFRSQLGVGVNEYERMYDFKRYVLDLAVEEINKKSDLKVSYEQEKKGRRIAGFKFKVLCEQKDVKKASTVQKDTNNDLYTIDGLSDKQLKRITRHKEFITTYNSLASGEAAKNWDAFTNFMVELIKKDPTRFSEKRPIQEYLNGQNDEYEYS